MEVRSHSNYLRGVEIEKMKISHIADTFSFGGGIQLVDSCDLCDTENISPRYARIIESLKRRELLPKKYPYVCCFCYNLLGILGYVRCKHCGDTLAFYHAEGMKTFKIKIECNNPKCEYGEVPLFEGRYNTNIKKLYKYNPRQLIEMMTR